MSTARTIYRDVEYLAERWNVSARSIYRWVKGGIPGTREPFPFSQVGRAVRWTDGQVADIERAMARAGFEPSNKGRRKKAAA